MERPILFTTEMVQAILKDDKTQTRRPIKNKYSNTSLKMENGILYHMQNDVPEPIKNDDGTTTFHVRYTEKVKNPWNVGDILWVRETWQLLPSGFDEIPPEEKYIYKASNDLSDECTRWRPSIHMPKSAARIFLKITNIRVENLSQISEESAKSEGIKEYTKDGTVMKYALNDRDMQKISWFNAPRTAKERFKMLWNESYDSPYSFDMNPWVWVIEFEHLKDYKIAV